MDEWYVDSTRAQVDLDAVLGPDGRATIDVWRIWLVAGIPLRQQWVKAGRPLRTSEVRAAKAAASSDPVPVDRTPPPMPTPQPGGGIGGTVDPAQVAAIVDAKIADAIPEARLLPVADGAPGMLLAYNEDTATSVGRWTQREALSRYRGAWSPDELLAVLDFTDGLTPFVNNRSGAALDAAVTTVATVGAANPPAWQNAVRIYPPTNAGVSNWNEVSVDLATLPDVDGHTLTRVVFFDAVYGGASTGDVALRVMQGEVVKATTRTTNDLASNVIEPWIEHTVALAGDGKVLSLRLNNTTIYVATQHRVYVAGIRVYGTTRPYSYGDVVDHLGTFYRSLANSNSEPPSNAVAWEPITP